MEFKLSNQSQATELKDLYGISITKEGYCIASTSPASGDKFTLDICEYEPWSTGKPDEKQVRDKLKELGLNESVCSSVLDVNDYELLNVEAPDVPEEELVSAVRWSIGDMVDFDIGNSVVDVFDSPVEGGQDRQKKIYVVAATKEKVQKRVSFLQKAQANLGVIDVPELVLRNLVELFPENEEGIAFLYMMERQGLILLIRDSYVYLARRLDVGTEDLMSVAKQMASLEADPSAEPVIQESHPLLADALVLEVLRSIDYYDRYFSLTPLSGLVIAPMGNELPGFQETLAKQLGINVRYLDLNEILDCKVPVSKVMQEHSFLAVGASLRSHLEQQEEEQEQDDTGLDQEQNLEAEG